MSRAIASKPEYANWVSARLVIVPFVLSVLLGGLSALSLWFAPLAVLAFACGCYFAYARRTFSSGGGDVQSKVQRLILDRLHWRGDGEVLDIGCGNGQLAIAIAKAYPAAHVTGVDRWGGGWVQLGPQWTCARRPVGTSRLGPGEISLGGAGPRG
jgi:hypothetical protein